MMIFTTLPMIICLRQKIRKLRILRVLHLMHRPKMINYYLKSRINQKIVQIYQITTKMKMNSTQSLHHPKQFQF
ncbi:unnamed protein product [Meloidogyne enterolobii]|uniref:Uncharacterized protein n=1 Tax=Meloidogyne enterolobii TaxID=390850 RepID=A0ACB0YQF4_MELEN